jgi:hypothetical protein
MKTLETLEKQGGEPMAIVLLDSHDLSLIDAVERSGYGWKLKRDPAEALGELLSYEHRCASKVVTEKGAVEVIVAALEKFKAWLEAAREVRKAPLGFWMDEDPPVDKEGPKGT